MRDGPEQVLFSGHPSWRSMLAFHAKGVASAIVVGAVAGVVTAGASGRVNSVWVALTVLVVFLAVFSSGLVRRRRTTYTVTSWRLTVEVGLVARDVHEARLEQIQNVSCRQSTLERLLGVGTVAFDTAGGREFDFSFRGIDDPRWLARMVGQALQERLSARL